MAFGQHAEIGRGGGHGVHGEHRVGVVIAAAGHEAAEGMILVGVVDPDRVVRHRLERFRRDLGGERGRAPGLAQHAGQDAVADGRLVGAPLPAMTARHQVAKALQRPAVVRVVPVAGERRVEMAERRVEGLEGEREDPRRHVEPPLGDECRIGDEARGRRRAVDQAHHVLDRGLGVLGERHEEVAQRQDLAGAALAHRRHHGHRVLVQHGGDTPGDLRRDRGVAFHEVGEPREHDGADHPVRQGVAPRRGDARRRSCGPALPLQRASTSCLRVGPDPWSRHRW